ncbi:MAG: hypothetical protein DWQ37_03455 [Planctomycetota bacterium]|nr:MAG: hypothetical protein DWQ37_03455 [Planctomycetota bacterium]
MRDQFDEYSDFPAPQGFPEQAPSGRSGSSKTWVLLLVTGGGVVALLVCCGGIGGFFYFGLTVFAKQVEAELRDNPALVEHVGAVQSFEIDWVATSAEADNDVFAFNVRGDQGEGVVTAKCVTTDDDSEEIAWATLRLPNGETVELVPETP